MAHAFPIGTVKHVKMISGTAFATQIQNPQHLFRANSSSPRLLQNDTAKPWGFDLAEIVGLQKAVELNGLEASLP